MRIAALEGNLQEECQVRQQAEANAAQQLQQNIQAQITGYLQQQLNGLAAGVGNHQPDVSGNLAGHSGVNLAL